MGFLFSTFSAVTELGVTAAVYAFIWAAWRRDRFHTGLIAFALTYEVLVNVAYMTFRMFSPSTAEYSAGMSTLLAVHGTLSLVMLIGLIAMVVAAVRVHQRGQNLFRLQPAATLAFVVLWALSVLSGEAIYVLLYL